LAKLVPSRQVDLLPEEIRADIAAVRGWMDRSNARHREHIVEEAGETWRTFGPVLDGT
jgi:hypothetical protein